MTTSKDILEQPTTSNLDGLPEDWEILRFPDCFLNKKGKTPHHINTENYQSSGEFPIIDQSAKYIAGFTDDESKIFKDNLPVIIFGDHTRIFKFVDFPFAIGAQGTKIFLPNKALFDPQFLFYYLSNLEIPNRGYNRHSKLLNDYSIVQPPLPEQHAITTTLRTVQEAKEKNDAVIAATKALKAAMMKYVFTYGPVPAEEADRIELRDSDFGSFPKKWKIHQLNECAYVQTGATKGKRISDDIAIEVPYLRVANVQDGYLDLSEMKSIRIRKNELNRFLLKKGDVVVTEGGDFDKLGRGFIWQGEIPVCVHQNHIFAIRPIPEIILQEYLSFLIQSEYGKKYFLSVAHRTTHLACINSTKLKALPVLIPTLLEQREIIDILSAIDQKLAAEQSRKEALDTLFASLLHNFMTANIRVKNIV